jgi:hypothetical protein
LETKTFKTWLDDEDCTIDIETHGELRGVVFLHVQVKRWNLRSAYRGYTLLSKLITELQEDKVSHIFTYNRNQDDKWRKFLKMYGFTFAFSTNEGLEMYVRKIA